MAKFQSDVAGVLLASTMMVAMPAQAQASAFRYAKIELAAAAGAIQSASPLAADNPEDVADADAIVVTAQRREEAAVDVPITITSLNQAALTAANVNALSDISRLTPSLRFDYSGVFVQPTIRGIGTSISTSGGGANVGIYVDGFYSPNPVAANTQLMRIKSIDVLKGPQGTLFGRNTTGGAILIQSAEPSTESAGEVRFSYGRYNEARGQGYATFGLSDTVAVDFEGQYRRGDGWLRDVTSGRKVGDFRHWSARFGLKAQMSDDVSFLLRYMHTDSDDPAQQLTNAYVAPDIGLAIASFAPPGSYTTNPDEVSLGKDRRYSRIIGNAVQATIRADLGFADLTSYSQYRSENSDVSGDLDRIGLTIFQLGLPIDNWTVSQELLLAGKPGRRLQWTAGLFYFSNVDTYRTFTDNNVATVGRVRTGGSSTTTKTYAAFVDATFELAPSLFVTAGGRYARDAITNAYTNPLGQGAARVFLPDVNQDKFTPRVVLRYKPSESSSIYASYSKGYKASILDRGTTVTRLVKPENIDAFEAGFKYAQRGFSVEASGFYYDYKDLQISLYRETTAQILNAASSEIYGIEGQVRLNLARGFEINASAAWTHGRYKKFDDAPVYRRCPATNQPVPCTAGLFYIEATDLRNVPMQRTPEFTGTLGARYSTELAAGLLALSGNLYYTSKFYYGPSGIQFPQEGYEVLSLRAEWTDPSDRYRVAVWGDNLTNSRYYTAIQYGNFGIGSNWSKPVTYGVELGAKF